ncbi:magnesium transporter MgtE N-terminal domain-containing protein [Cohnella yongneupensis]|uniref:Magnesium transporter MgtE N-terminal domain-containing protein n=1 Tax=Cohnella yongneupensis TaxID=425006 RepID=A0ABW0R5E1_9BACL
MASANVEKEGYSGFERFLFFITPILFTAVLLGVLLLMFNKDWRNAALEVGNKIPIVKSIVPDPSADAPTTPANTDEELTVSNAKDKIAELNALLTDRDNALKQATDQAGQDAKKIEGMQAELDLLKKESTDRTITAEAYDAKIKSLADMYAKMSPSKAGPILENMTIDEAALVLGSMTTEERGKVLERMTPKKAADVTMKLKDTDTVNDREIAALQARISELEVGTGSDATMLDTAELNRTFSAMAPDKAAAMLLQMAGTSQSKALRILGALDNASRSSILAAMTDADKKTTVALVSKLMPANP